MARALAFPDQCLSELRQEQGPATLNLSPKESPNQSYGEAKIGNHPLI